MKESSLLTNQLPIGVDIDTSHKGPRGTRATFSMLVARAYGK